MAFLFSNKIDEGFLRHGRYKYSKTIDGRKHGFVLATKTKGYDRFALNKKEFDELLAGKRNGRIDEARVVAAESTDNRPGLVHRGEIDAEKLETRLKDETPRSGQFGPFYVLDNYVFSDEDAPF
jgi:hypothetical protein